ncbi:MAG: M67 family metallopeptidase [Chloroflexota bacterium]
MMRPGSLTIPRAEWEKMSAHVSREAPLEACGILAGTGDRAQMTILVANAAQSPARFRMEAREQWLAFVAMEDAGLEMLSVFHSHPNGPPIPSPTDVAEAAYPVVNIIWSPGRGGWEARGFWIEAGQVSEVPLLVEE